MKNTLTALLVAALLPTISPVPASADDLGAIFKKVGELVEAKNYPKALEELGWAKNEIEKLHGQQLRGFFPDELAGFKGGKTEANMALGIVNLERDYTKGDKEVSLSLTGGSGGASQPGLGNLAQLGKMAAMMGGGSEGQETIRIAGKTAMLEKNEESESASLSIFLDSGSIVKLEMNEKAEVETLKSMAQALKLADLERYLSGAK